MDKASNYPPGNRKVAFIQHRARRAEQVLSACLMSTRGIGRSIRKKGLGGRGGRYSTYSGPKTIALKYAAADFTPVLVAGFLAAAPVDRPFPSQREPPLSSQTEGRLIQDCNGPRRNQLLSAKLL